MENINNVLVIGASGSVGRPVVEELTARGLSVRVLVRASSQRNFPESTDVRIGDITDPDAFPKVVDDIDAVVFTHGANGDPVENEAVDYGAVKNLLAAVQAPVRIALMTAIGVTDHTVSYNISSHVHDWKRRSERLVRASGMPYTIVRPAWFDYNEPDQHHLVFLQGDRRSTGTPADGVIARQQIAEILVSSLFSEEATFKTFELVAEKGEAQSDLNPLFAALEPDETQSLDGVRDQDTLPLASEPALVSDDIDTVRQRGPRS